MTAVGNLQPIISGHTTSLATLQTDVATNTADLSTKTTEIAVLNSIQVGHGISIANNSSEIFRLNGISLNHTTLISDIRTLLDDSVTTLIQHNTSIQQNGTTLGIFQQDFIDLRADVDANTLQGSQLLTAIQYQSDSIFAIDTAIQGLNGQVGSLETTQVTHDDLIREFDQNFNEPTNGVIFKIDNLISIYNTHIDGSFLDIRQNVDDNNAILGTLSTQTTSLLTAMTQIYTRVEDLEEHHP
jgi:hypothetical protein